MLIRNDGPTITSTDYWSSDSARAGLLYLSINAGVARLLVPATDTLGVFAEVAGARRAAIQVAGATAVGLVHLLFENDTPTPWFCSLNTRQCDRSPPLSEAGRWIRLALYCPDGAGPKHGAAVALVREMPALVRIASREVDQTPVPEAPHADA